MSTKKIIGISIGSVFLVVLVWVVVGIAGIASEASKMDSLLKNAVQQKEPIAQFQQEATNLGFELKPDGSKGLIGTGGGHWVLVYKTWLTLSVSAGADGAVNSYHMDRSGSIF